MPTNKNAQLRYQIIDKCLSNWSRRYYIEDLVDACNEALYLYNGETKDGCGVKKRQVQEDLKFIESEEGYRLLGDFIRQVDVRNTDGKEENLFGVSVQKMFIPSIANTIGTDFTKYKVVKRGQFTYIPDTSRRGDKIGIALLMDYDEGLVSNIYTVFEVKDENELLPEYLMLWFSRPEFDRYARFKSHGSVREIMDWDEMCKVELPVPSIDKQRSIVKAYQTITERIELKRRINDNLAA